MWNPGWPEAAEGPAILSIASVSLAPGRDAQSTPGWQERELPLRLCVLSGAENQASRTLGPLAYHLAGAEHGRREGPWAGAGC